MHPTVPFGIELRELNARRPCVKRQVVTQTGLWMPASRHDIERPFFIL